MHSPSLSIIIPTHNRPQLLRRAIRSALAQTLPNIEIVVVDDASTPPVTLPDYPQVRIIRLSPGKGGAAARNVGVQAASAQWITYLDDDDELMPNMAQISLAAIAQATLPKPIGILSALAELNTEEQIRKVHSPPTLPKGKHFCLEEIDRHHSFASKQTLVIERQVLLDIGGFDETFTSRVHTELFLRLNAVCSLVGLSEVTYRLHAHDGPRVSSSLQRRQQNFHRLIKKHHALFSSYPRSRYADFVFNHAYMLHRNQYYLAAIIALFNAFKIHPVQVIARLGSPYKAKLLKLRLPFLPAQSSSTPSS